MNAREELFDNLRQWVPAHVANALIDDFAHALANRQRAWEGPGMTMTGRLMVPLEMLADSIDPYRKDAL